jgi:hypothetical protein
LHRAAVAHSSEGLRASQSTRAEVSSASASASRTVECGTEREPPDVRASAATCAPEECPASQVITGVL